MLGERSDLISIMQEVQAKFGYLPEAAMQRIAQFVRVPVSQVYGVATFYALFRLTPGGKRTIRVCQGTACHVQGGPRILAAVKDKLKVTPGGTTPDGAFSLEVVSCIGACALAPNMTIDKEVYGQMTPAKVEEILAKEAKA